MTSILLILTYLGCVSSGAMLSMLLLLIAAYVSAAIWLVVHGAVYSGLLYVLVYVGAIVVLIMFVVQLTNTSLASGSPSGSSTLLNVPLVAIQNGVLVVCLSLLLTVAYNMLGSDLLLNVSSLNLDHIPSISGGSTGSNNVVSSVTEYLDKSTHGNSLVTLASSLFNEYGYILILSVHAIILAVIGPIKLALADYTPRSQ